MDKSTFIFDMDGVLIDSEPHWQAVEKQVFADIGITLTSQMCAQTTGLRNSEVVALWHQRFGWQQPSVEQVGRNIINEMVKCFKSNPQFKPGAKELITRLGKNPNNRLAICSSSPDVLIEALVEVMDIGEYVSLVHSAENDEFGKPHPLPYLKCAEKLGSAPGHCVVFEDSLYGALSAKAAGMFVVAVPDGPHTQDKFAFCDQVIDSLEHYR